jgi:hypothetical protein
VSDKDLDLARENERLRRENRILKEERDILIKATAFFASQKPWGSGSSKSMAANSRPIAFARFWMSANVACGPIAADLPVKGNGLT